MTIERTNLHFFSILDSHLLNLSPVLETEWYHTQLSGASIYFGLMKQCLWVILTSCVFVIFNAIESWTCSSRMICLRRWTVYTSCVCVCVGGYEKESHSRRYGFATTSQAEASVTGPKFMRAGCTPRLFYLCCIKHHLVILKLGVTQQRRLYSLASSVAQHTLWMV